MKIQSKKVDEDKSVEENVNAVNIQLVEQQKPMEQKKTIELQKPISEPVVEKITKTTELKSTPVTSEPLKTNAVQINITSAQDGFIT